MLPAAIADYHAPTTILGSLDLLSGDDSTMFIAGGMSLMQAIKARLVRPSCLIDLQHVSEMKGISVDPSGIRIGAMTRYRDIAASRALSGSHGALIDAAAHVGDRQVRNRGTIGGSLCWNYISACAPVAAITVGASIVLQSKSRGRRSMPVEDFLISPMETARQSDEIAVAVTLPSALPRAGSAYRKWGLVADALPVIGIGVCVSIDEYGRCVEARVGIGGLADGSKRCLTAEQHLVGLRVSDHEGVVHAFETAAAAADVQADMWTDEPHRRALIREVGTQVAISAFERAGAHRP